MSKNCPAIRFSALPKLSWPNKDPRRVNLGVGVYQDENGKVPLLACIKQAEEKLLAKAGAAFLCADRRPRRL